MRKVYLPSVCALGLLIGASPAYAGTYGDTQEPIEGPAAAPAPPAVVETVETDYAATGPYLGVGGLYAIEFFSDGNARTDNSAGFHVRAGYRFMPNMSVELLYQYLNKFDVDPGHIDGWSLTANAKAYVLTGRIQPYALVGVGYINTGGSAGNHPAAASTGDGTLMRFGIGMDVCLGEHWAIGPELAYDLPFGSAEDLDYMDVSIGVRYKI